MQHRTTSPNTQSGTSVKFKAVILLVLSKQLLSFTFTCVFHLRFKQRRPKTRTPTRHLRIITAISGLGVAAVRFMFLKQRSRRERRCFYREDVDSAARAQYQYAFYTGRFM